MTGSGTESRGLIPYIRGTPETDKQHKQHGINNRATRCTSRRAQIQAETTNISRRLWNIEGRKYKFQAYMGLQNSEHERLMRQSERAATRITDTDLETAAQTQEEATLWKQLSQEMKYILASVTSGGAATVCRQHQRETDYEIYRQLNKRYSIPVGARSIGYLTKLLNPTLDPNNFEESSKKAKHIELNFRTTAGTERHTFHSQGCQHSRHLHQARQSRHTPQAPLRC